jgi:hypothetical protein
MRFLGVHSQAGFCVAAMAVKAKTAGDIEGQHHPVARFDALDDRVNFFDYPHYLVADDSTLVQRSSAIIYNLDDAREFLAGQNIDVDAIAPQVDGRIMSAFVRAVKPVRN